MATSKFVSRVVVFVFLLISAGKSSACAFFEAGFVVTNWASSVPSQIVVYQYKKGSGFSLLEKSFSDWSVIGGFSDRAGSRYISISPIVEKMEWTLPVDADYLMVVDNKIEFRFSNIVSAGRIAGRCPLKSAAINSCEIKSSRLVFDMGCGAPFLQK
jgi:hypothetical protein